MNKRDTKNKLIDKAIEMFNKQGASNVSTVQLAGKLKISPGNLYYYFDNKEHLIREIYTHRILSGTLPLYKDTDIKNSESGVLKLLTGIVSYTYKYRFFFLEENTLLKNDPLLCKLRSDNLKKNISDFHEIVKTWIKIGIMKDLKSEQQTLLTENFFAVSRAWLTFADITDPMEMPGRMDMKSAVLHIYFVLLPYLTEVGKSRIARLFELNDFDTAGLF